MLRIASKYSSLPSRALSLSSLSRFSLPLVSLLSPRSRSRSHALSLSLLSHTRVSHSRVFSLSCFSLSRSRRSAGSSHFTCRAMSRAAYPMPPLRPFHRPSLRISSSMRHAASTPGSAGYKREGWHVQQRGVPASRCKGYILHAAPMPRTCTCRAAAAEVVVRMQKIHPERFAHAAHFRVQKIHPERYVPVERARSLVFLPATPKRCLRVCFHAFPVCTPARP